MSIASAIGNYVKGIGLSLFGELKPQIEHFLSQFVENDLGKVAVSAVQFIEAEMPGASDQEKREAAKAKFVADAKAAGHDAGVFGEALLNFVIEAAVQIALAAAAAGVAKV